MTGKSCITFYPTMQCMAKVSEMYVRHRGTAHLEVFVSFVRLICFGNVVNRVIVICRSVVILMPRLSLQLNPRSPVLNTVAGAS